jgi:hypothetical protein
MALLFQVAQQVRQVPPIDIIPNGLPIKVSFSELGKSLQVIAPSFNFSQTQYQRVMIYLEQNLSKSAAR